MFSDVDVIKDFIIKERVGLSPDNLLTFITSLSCGIATIRDRRLLRMTLEELKHLNLSEYCFNRLITDLVGVNVSAQEEMLDEILALRYSCVGDNWREQSVFSLIASTLFNYSFSSPSTPRGNLNVIDLLLKKNLQFRNAFVCGTGMV